MRVLKQSTAYNLAVFMTDSSDHVSGKTGATLTITASKDGAAFASISPTVTELANGWYKVALTSSHTDTLGDLALHVTASGADPSDLAVQVRANVLGDTLPANATQVNGVSTSPVTAVAANLGTAQPVNFSGTGAAAYVKADLEQWVGVAPQAIGATGGLPTLDAAGAVTANLLYVVGDMIGDHAGGGDYGLAFQTFYGGAAADPAAVVWAAADRQLTALDEDATTIDLDATIRAAISTELARIDVATSTRMATYTQPTGFLAATFPASPAAVGSAMTLDLTQVVSQVNVTSDTTLTVGKALLSARAQAAGAWTLVGTTLTLKNPDGTTFRAFVLDSATTPTTRT